MTTTDETKAASAVSQRAETLALAELNQRSAGLGYWEVGISRRYIHDYKWTPKNTGQEKIGADFRCTLVSVRDPSQYVIAHISMRSGNKAPLQNALAKFKSDLKFRIRKVALDSSDKQQYFHTPIKFKIDFGQDEIRGTDAAKAGRNRATMSIYVHQRLQKVAAEPAL